jgi:hypothetical protein
MKIDRLLKTARAIQDQKFEFDMWSDKIAACGTAGCVAGTIAALYPSARTLTRRGKRSPRHWDDISVGLALGFNMSDESSFVDESGDWHFSEGFKITDALFYGDNTVDLDDITRWMAVDTLVTLARTGKVVWRKGITQAQSERRLKRLEERWNLKEPRIGG